MASRFIRTLARVSLATRRMTTKTNPEFLGIMGELKVLNKESANMRKVVEEGIGELKVLNKERAHMRKVVEEGVKAVKETLKDIQGYVNHSTTAMEEEVVAAVCTALRDMNLEVIKVKYNFSFADPVTGDTLCEPDGLILLGNGSWALVEVGHWIDAAKLAQVAKTKQKLTDLGFRIMYEFVGGPSFEKDGKKGMGMKEVALARGHSVVVVTGERYQVVFPPTLPPPHLAPPRPHLPLPLPPSHLGSRPRLQEDSSG